MRSLICLWAVALAIGSAEAVTKHYSFAGGYPTTTVRQPTSATGASFGASQSGRTKKPEEKTLVGKVVRVDSGDQVCVTPTGGRRTTVRLERVSAPAHGQPSGVEAKKFLFKLINGRDVTVRYFPQERAETIAGTVYVQLEEGLVEVNLTVIQNGWAWFEKSSRPAGGSKEASRDRAYAAAEKEAKEAKRGLWAAPNPVNPSEWRKQRYGADRSSRD